MENLVRFFLKRKVLVNSVIISVFLLGIRSLFDLPKMDIPLLKHHQILITTPYVGASPTLVEQQVTLPIEDAIGSLVGKEKIVSYSKPGLSLITITLGTTASTTDLENYSGPLFKALQTLSLPGNAGRPVLQQQRGDDEVIVELALTGPQENLVKVASFLQNELIKVDGVSNATIMGGSRRTTTNHLGADYWLMRYNGERGIGIMLHKESSADTLATAKQIKEKLSELTLPSDVKLSFVNDRSVVITSRLFALFCNVMLGLVLMFALLWIIFDRRVAIWVEFALLFSFMGLMIFLWTCDMTLDLFTLGSVILAMGLVIDVAIVIAEKIFVHKEKGIPDYDAATKAVGKIWRPLLITMVIVSFAFTPLLVFTGTINATMATIFLVVIVLLAFGLIDSYFILPMQLLHSGKQKIDRKNWIVSLENKYENLLRACVKFRYGVLLLFIGALISALFLIVTKIHHDSFPANWSNRFAVKVMLGDDKDKIDLTVNMAEQKIQKIETQLKSLLGERLKNLSTRMGSSDLERSLVTLPLWREAVLVAEVDLSEKVQMAELLESLKGQFKDIEESEKVSLKWSVIPVGPQWGRLGEIFIMAQGDGVREQHVAQIEEMLGDSKLVQDLNVEKNNNYHHFHFNGSKASMITFVAPSSLLTVKKFLQELSQKFSRSSELQVDISGETFDEYQILQRALLASLLALMAMYLVMALIFNSFKTPFLVIFSMPFMGVGVIFAYYLSGLVFSFFSGIALLAIMALLLSNSLLLIHTIREMQERIQLGRMILIDAAVGRFRPMVASILTTVVGILPVAYGICGYDQVIGPMGIAICYGPLFGILILLFLVPCLYEIGNDLKQLRS